MFTVPNGMLSVPFPLNWMPCIRAFGTGFPPKFWYPSRVHRYKPLSMCTPSWQRSLAAARAVAGVPSAIAPAKHTDAQAKAKELIVIFVNFVFIVVLSFFLIFVVSVGSFFSFCYYYSCRWRELRPLRVTAFLQTAVKVLNGPLNFSETL